METKPEIKQRSIAKVNGVSIVVIEENKSKKIIPIKPLCEALGVDFEGQRQRINRDEILNSVAFMTKATGSDGKDYEMFCLPLKFVFGWLFSIDTSRVKDEARPEVIAYKLQCYNVLYDYFSEYAEFVEVRGRAIEIQLDKYQTLQHDFRDARFNLDEAKKKMNQAKGYTFDDYKMNKNQFKLDFLEESEPIELEMQNTDLEE